MFFDIFSTLCTEKNLSGSAILKELGIATGTITKWKNGTLPNASQLVLLSSYFDCSIDFLLGITKNRKPIAIDIAQMINEETVEIIETYTDMDFKQRARLVAYMLELRGE